MRSQTTDHVRVIDQAAPARVPSPGHVPSPRPAFSSAAQRRRRGVIGGAAALVLGAGSLLLVSQSATAIGTPVGLGAADSYAVLGGESVTNDHGTIPGGNTVLWGDLGVSPGSAITGFPPGIRLGSTHVDDVHARDAKLAVKTAYDAIAAQARDATIVTDLGGQRLDPGVYFAESSAGLTGALTLDAHGDPDAVFIFQITSALTTATASSIVPVNGASSCNIYWQIGSSATLGERTSFVGTILALESITLDSGATVDGRALARTGSVTLLDNVFTGAPCGDRATTPPTSPAPSTSPPPTSPAPNTSPPPTSPAPSTSPPPTSPGPSTSPPPTSPAPSSPGPSNPSPTNTGPGTPGGGDGGGGSGNGNGGGSGSGGSGSGGSGSGSGGSGSGGGDSSTSGGGSSTGGGGSSTGTSTGSLARTGFDAAPLVATALAATLLGLATLLFWTRRTPRTT